jgi:toxin ParE1/3/4
LPPSRTHPAEWDSHAPQADFDLDDIWFYVATKSGSLDTADRLVDSITDRFYLIATHPNIGRARDEDLRPGLRSFPVGEYVIIYRIQDDDILILRVLRGSRDIPALFGR